MKLKTSELQGVALDWAVAKCEVLEVWREPDGMYLCEGGEVGFRYRPSTDWAQGGTIIEREGIDLQYQGGDTDVWAADMFNAESMIYGDTPLIAAMRCYVASKLGEEVEIPEDLTFERI